MMSIRVNTFTILLLLFLLFNNCSSENLRPGEDVTSNPVLLISIDGFMPEYMDRNDTPNLDCIAQQGVRAKSMIAVFPSKTFPSHYSIVTGLYPENHGIITNSFYDFELEANFSFGPPDSGPEDDKWWGGEPVWVTAEKQSKTAATVFWPGSDSNVKGIRPTRYLDYEGSLPNISRIDTVISWLDPKGEVRADFSTLYYSEVDSYGHSYGPRSDETDMKVREADQWIGYLLEQMEEYGLTDNLNVILISDHGMAELSEDRVVFLDDLINMNDVAIIDWTPVAMIRPDEGKTDEIYRALKENENNYKVYLKDELPDEYHFRNHYRIPEIIMIADLGYSITTRPFLEDRNLQAATHGYNPDLPEMHGIFFAMGPDFKQGYETETIESIHLYELMAHILGLEPAPNDGSFDEIRHVLREWD